VTPKQRQFLDHATPPWIKGHRNYFITICTVPRRLNQLCLPAVAEAVFSAAAHYHARKRWHVEIMLLMPDHLHAMLGFPNTESMSQVVRSWKHYLSSTQRIAWQRDYFDHRLRNHENHQQKTDYIRMNPVRAGLISAPELWPYVWQPEM